jgi:hypothetical protein
MHATALWIAPTCYSPTEVVREPFRRKHLDVDFPTQACSISSPIPPAVFVRTEAGGAFSRVSDALLPVARAWMVPSG